MMSKYRLFALILFYWLNALVSCYPNLVTTSYFAESVSRVSWTEEEKDAVFKHLSSFVRQGRFPGKRDCENCFPKSNGALERRDWRAVKSFVKNQVDKRKRVLAPKNS